MAVANLSWDVDAATLAALVAAGFDAWIVERTAAGPVVTEISYATTRPPLVANVLSYVYADGSATIDANGDIDPAVTYSATPVKTSDATVDVPVAASATRRGYIIAQDIWNEGYANPPWIPTKVWLGIDRATAAIDSITSQWFEPRYMQLSFDGVNHDQQWLNIPICALHQLFQDDTGVDLDDLSIYNRHLTRGMLSPDDRQNPKVTYALEFPVGYRRRQRRIVADASLFDMGRKNIIMKGVFGYTEIGPGNMAAETADQSQIPVSYGQTPADIVRAALLLALTYMMPAEDQQEASLQGRITEVKTRDQVVRLSDPVGADGSFGLTGNIEVDNILMRYAGPIRMGTIG